MVAGAPKIACSEVNTRLGGTYSGSDDVYWFWNTSISSGSLWDIVSGSDIYLRSLIGESTWDSTAADTANLVKRLELNHVCYTLLVQLSGGVITDGFSWSTGPIRVDAGSMIPGWQNIINGFKESTLRLYKILDPSFVLSYDWDAPVWDKTSSSPM